MKLFKKIDFYYLGDYVYSTQQSRTIKEAKSKLIQRLEMLGQSRLGLLESQMLKNSHLIKAFFAK